MMPTTMRRALCAATLLAAAPALSGCLGPTYGTGKSQGETLFDDLNNVVSIGSDNRTAEIAYSPRPELVRPENTSVLPAPQPVRNTTSDPNWPESPEERSARRQAAAFQSDGPVPADIASSRKEGVTEAYLDRTRGTGYTRRNTDDGHILSPAELRGRGELLRERQQASKQGSPTQRRYLSEPPIAYRQPAATAPVGEPGLDESVKQRRLRGSTGDGLGARIRDMLPF